MSALGSVDYRTADYFGLEDRWIETAPDEVTHFHDLGEGTAVVFLHGSGTGVSAAANWWLTLPEIAGPVRAIALDLIGWGATVHPEGTAFGIREWGDHVLRLLDALGIESAWLVGNSLGGWIALQLAIDHPERVLGVVSMGTGGAIVRTAAISQHLDPDISFDGLRGAFGAFVTDPTILDDDMVSARQEVAEYEVRTGRLAQVMAARERDRHRLPLDPEALGHLSMPVLLVHGMQDVVIPPSRAWELVGQIPTADALLLNGCGHWSMIERSEEFTRALRGAVFGGDRHCEA